MPYRSKNQRSWMHIHEPEIAKKWDKKYGGKIQPHKRGTGGGGGSPCSIQKREGGME